MKNMKKWHSFLSENLKFLEEKFSIYLNKCVFVMLHELEFYLFILFICLFIFIATLTFFRYCNVSTVNKP